MIKCKIDWFASKEWPCKGLLRNGWWGERIEKKLCERLGTSLDLKPEVGKKRTQRSVNSIYDRMRELRTADREALSRFLNL